MLSNRKMNSVKRIAFAANDSNNRKSLIEWSYYNQEVLKNHELIATGTMASILEGTIGVLVTRLQEGAAAANQQLASLAEDQKIDVLIFFWDPQQPLQSENGIRYLHDLAVANNIIIACNLATADFILLSLLMDKVHTVPVLQELRQPAKSAGYANMQQVRSAALKVNAIH